MSQASKDATTERSIHRRMRELRQLEADLERQLHMLRAERVRAAARLRTLRPHGVHGAPDSSEAPGLPGPGASTNATRSGGRDGCKTQSA